MRTCSKCGCYIPDNWTTCPACQSKEQTEIKKDTVGIFRVDVLYNDGSKYFGSGSFSIYENAERYAIQQLTKPLVTATQIIRRGKVVETFFSNRY